MGEPIDLTSFTIGPPREMTEQPTGNTAPFVLAGPSSGRTKGKNKEITMDELLEMKRDHQEALRRDPEYVYSNNEFRKETFLLGLIADKVDRGERNLPSLNSHMRGRLEVVLQLSHGRNKSELENWADAEWKRSRVFLKTLDTYLDLYTRVEAGPTNNESARETEDLRPTVEADLADLPKAIRHESERRYERRPTLRTENERRLEKGHEPEYLRRSREEDREHDRGESRKRSRGAAPDRSLIVHLQEPPHSKRFTDVIGTVERSHHPDLCSKPTTKTETTMKKFQYTRDDT